MVFKKFMHTFEKYNNTWGWEEWDRNILHISVLQSISSAEFWRQSDNQHACLNIQIIGSVRTPREMFIYVTL